jgi:hypothetical protein
MTAAGHGRLPPAFVTSRPRQWTGFVVQSAGAPPVSRDLAADHAVNFVQLRQGRAGRRDLYVEAADVRSPGAWWAGCPSTCPLGSGRRDRRSSPRHRRPVHRPVFDGVVDGADLTVCAVVEHGAPIISEPRVAGGCHGFARLPVSARWTCHSAMVMLLEWRRSRERAGCLLSGRA